MNNILLTCPHCNKIFKIVRKDTVNGLPEYITDFNDKFILQNSSYHCISCGYPISFRTNAIVTDDWIADMVFNVKSS